MSKALEREHVEIDRGIDSFSSGPEGGEGGDSKTAGLTAALGELRRHIYFEEELLFPPLRDAGLVPPLLVMCQEHGEIWATMDALTVGVTSGADAALLRHLVDRLIAQLQEHNQKEEMIVYPAADRMIAAATPGEPG
ncbi:MAG: hemerythrin domain-containing protein, partial [Acidimicrobiales bacterium]